MNRGAPNLLIELEFESGEDRLIGLSRGLVACSTAIRISIALVRLSTVVRATVWWMQWGRRCGGRPHARRSSAVHGEEELYDGMHVEDMRHGSAEEGRGGGEVVA